MQVGEIIKHDTKLGALKHKNWLAKQGITTEFMLKYNGEKGIWLIVTRVEEKK